jgi:hypothetical protein
MALPAEKLGIKNRIIFKANATVAVVNPRMVKYY